MVHLCVGIALHGAASWALATEPERWSASPIQLEQMASGGSIEIDGRLDESIWAGLEAFDNMTVIEPDIEEPARYSTASKFFYTDKGLYVGIHNEQPSESLVARLSGRDSGISRDGVRLVLDTSGEGLYGYFFQLNLGDAISDGIVLPERRFQDEWDGPWRYATKRTAEGWDAEIFLPWSMMSMPQNSDGVRRMGVSIDRRLAQLNERWAWPPLPYTQPRFMSALQPIEVRDVSPQQQYSIFPYLSSTVDGVRDDSEYDGGVDLFWRPSANFLLSATLSPDFGQVEADDVVINLTAFETFFPEKRLFFLENQEIFITSPRASQRHGPNGGGSVVTLVNTRRIGASVVSRRELPDYYPGLSLNEFERNQPVDLLGALKATAQHGSYRFGVLTAFEDDTAVRIAAGGTGERDAPGRDFAIARFLFEEGSGGGRRALGAIATLVDHPVRQAATYGVDGHLLSDDGVWEVDGQLLFSDIQESRVVVGTSIREPQDSSGAGAFAILKYAPERGTTHTLNLDYYDRDLDVNDFGFLRRNDLIGAEYTFDRRNSNPGRVRDRDYEIQVETAYNHDDRLIDGEVSFNARVTFHNNSRIFTNVNFSPAQWDDRNSDGNGSFKLRETWSASISFGSDFSKPVSYQFSTGIDRESTFGYERQYRAELMLRPDGPWNASLNVRYTSRDAWLIHRTGRNFGAYESEQWRPRLSFSSFFSAHQELKLQLQWAGVKAYPVRLYDVPLGDGWLEELPPDAVATASNFSISDMTLQLRYRWEFAPLSDLFVVYSRGGYDTETGELEDFGGLFDATYSDPDTEFLIVKLRYRFGS